MIKANELRVGNWVNRLGKPTIITAVQQGEEIGYVTTPISGAITTSQIEPIPITEQVLLDCGFEVWEKTGLLIKDAWSPGHPAQRFDLSWSEKTGFLCKSRYQAESEFMTMRHIQHLHSLMNLFFSLTGQELTYKPNAEAHSDLPERNGL